MTNPTDPRIEAAARVIQKAVGGENSAFFDFLAADALKAGWLPIESAPLDREIITYYPDGRVMADKFPYRGFLEWREQIYAPPILWQPLPKAPKP